MPVIKITPEIGEWLRTNNEIHRSWDELVSKIKDKFGVDLKVDSLMAYYRRNGLENPLSYNTKFTEEQVQWVIKNFDKYQIKDLTDVYNKEFNQARSYESIRTLTEKKLKLKKRHIVSDDQKQWLIKNRPGRSNKELLSMFNKKYGTSYTDDRGFFVRNGIPSNRKKTVRFTPEYEQWIIENYEQFVVNGYTDFREFCKAFNEYFNTDITVHAFNMKLNRMFPDSRDNSIQVRKGILKYVFPIGNEVRFGDHIKIKLADGVYRLKENLLYEQYHGVSIDDKNQVVVFLNGDWKDYSKENLYLISRKLQHTYLTRIVSSNSSKRLEPNIKLRRIGLLTIELEEAMRDVRGNNE